MKIETRFMMKVLYEDDTTTIKATVIAAVERGANLRGAYLSGANLRGADLRGANLRGADLRGADLRDADLGGAYLRGAYLRGADLRGAYLSGADLRGAVLRGADLRGTYLRGAVLSGAVLDWQSHALLGEILFAEAGSDVADDTTYQRRAFAGLVAVSTDWCWDTWRTLAPRYPDVTTWAIDVLAEYVQDGDDAPDEIRTVAAARSK